MPPPLPHPRGPLSEAVVARLTDDQPLPLAPDLPIDPLTDDDLQLALWCCFELHYHGFEGVDPKLEWDPDLIAFRRALEDAFLGALRDEHRPGALPDAPSVALRIIATWAGPPLSTTLAEEGTLDQLREFVIHRSAYQLKEADGHTWGIPRLAGPGRAALIEIQADEYGQGEPGQAHAEIFAEAMLDLGLDNRFGHFVDRLPGVTLATDNLISLFGLHRRWRGALVGHLALFEMTSVTPMSRYLDAARRHGGLPSLERFYEVHVEADVHHRDLAINQLVGAFADHEDLADDIVFGAAALARCEARFAHHVLDSWRRGESSLLPPPPEVRADEACEPTIDLRSLTQA